MLCGGKEKEDLEETGIKQQFSLWGGKKHCHKKHLFKYIPNIDTPKSNGKLVKLAVMLHITRINCSQILLKSRRKKSCLWLLMSVTVTVSGWFITQSEINVNKILRAVGFNVGQLKEVNLKWNVNKWAQVNYVRLMAEHIYIYITPVSEFISVKQDFPSGL